MSQTSTADEALGLTRRELLTHALAAAAALSGVKSVAAQSLDTAAAEAAGACWSDTTAPLSYYLPLRPEKRNILEPLGTSMGKLMLAVAKAQETGCTGADDPLLCHIRTREADVRARALEAYPELRIAQGCSMPVFLAEKLQPLLARDGVILLAKSLTLPAGDEMVIVTNGMLLEAVNKEAKQFPLFQERGTVASIEWGQVIVEKGTFDLDMSDIGGSSMHDHIIVASGKGIDPKTCYEVPEDDAYILRARTEDLVEKAKVLGGLDTACGMGATKLRVALREASASVLAEANEIHEAHHVAAHRDVRFRRAFAPRNVQTPDDFDVWTFTMLSHSEYLAYVGELWHSPLPADILRQILVASRFSEEDVLSPTTAALHLLREQLFEEVRNNPTDFGFCDLPPSRQEADMIIAIEADKLLQHTGALTHLAARLYREHDFSFDFSEYCNRAAERETNEMLKDVFSGSTPADSPFLSPGALLTGALVLGGTGWVISRRMQNKTLEREEEKKAQNAKRRKK